MMTTELNVNMNRCSKPSAGGFNLHACLQAMQLHNAEGFEHLFMFTFSSVVIIN